MCQDAGHCWTEAAVFKCGCFGETYLESWQKLLGRALAIDTPLDGNLEVYTTVAERHDAHACRNGVDAEQGGFLRDLLCPNMSSHLIPRVCEQEGFEEEVTVPLARMEYGSLGQCYVLLKREASSMTLGKLGACMQFTVKEIDPSTGE